MIKLIYEGGENARASRRNRSGDMDGMCNRFKWERPIGGLRGHLLNDVRFNRTPVRIAETLGDNGLNPLFKNTWDKEKWKKKSDVQTQ